MHTHRVLLLASATLFACSAPETVDPGASGHDHSTSVVGKAAQPNAAVNAQLAAARAATARYQKLETALADGFADINVFIPGMGYHYLNLARLDADFDAANPELLVYSREKNGRMRLVAIEYAVPTALASQAPAGFPGSGDVWDENTTFALWTLHAWVWHNNPDGIFAPLNPRLN